MTRKQKRFADEYLVDLNGTRAYKVAYPSVKRDETARANASRLLTNANVQSYIQERMKDRQERTQIDQDRVLREVSEIAFDRESEKITTKDRLRALQLLGRHLGLFDAHKDELDIAEQEARIAKLRAETKTETDGDVAVTVSFVDTYGAEE
jgi:phage terminase small subunit